MDKRVLGVAIAALAVCGQASAQSLFQRPEPVEPREDVDPTESLQGVSLYVLPPEPPREFQPNDLITIIINEVTNMKREHTMEAEKEYRTDLELVALNELIDYLKDPSGAGSANSFDARPIFDYENEFKGESEYERKDNIAAKVTARVLEIKPNGTLLLEARTSVKTDDESQTIILSGLVREEDVTERNTVYSNQMFNLAVDIQNEGEMRRTTKKGWIPRVFETLFNF